MCLQLRSSSENVTHDKRQCLSHCKQSCCIIMQPLGVSNPLSQGVRARIKLHGARC
jgi:hypothetical protein